jgi:sugar (pentulose or hexulose) kinase
MYQLPSAAAAAGGAASAAGSLSELYSLLPDGCLAVTAETRVGAKQASSVTVYRRSAGSREALLADSRRRNGSVADVLCKQQDQGLRT